jgi:hypothetical protein
MALPANTFTTYGNVGIREDLSDVIYNIAPTETPVLSALPRRSVDAVQFDWQTDTLAAAANTNHQLEGDDTPRQASTPPVRLNNVCQISFKDATVSGTQEATKRAGRKSELAYQIAKKGRELKRDMELILTASRAANAGAVGTARITRSLRNFLVTGAANGGAYAVGQGMGTGGANPVLATLTSVRTDGTQRALTETLLRNQMQIAWSNGAEPSMIVCSGDKKVAIAGFTGRAGQQIIVPAQKITAGVTIYSSDFGDLKVVPNRFMQARDLFLLDPEYAAVSYLRPMQSIDIAKTGDNQAKLLLAEWGIEVRNEGAHSALFDLT